MHGGDNKCLRREPQGKRPLARPRHSLKDNIKMNLKEICCKLVNWIHPAQDSVQRYAVMNIAVIIRVAQKL